MEGGAQGERGVEEGGERPGVDGGVEDLFCMLVVGVIFRGGVVWWLRGWVGGV